MALTCIIPENWSCIISIESLSLTLKSLVMWSFVTCLQTSFGRSIFSLSSVFLESFFSWQVEHFWMYLDIFLLIMSQKVMSVTFRRVSLKLGYPAQRSLWHFLIVLNFSSSFSTIIFPQYSHLSSFRFLTSEISINRWYPCCFVFFRLIVYKNIFWDSNSSVASFLQVNTSATTLFFLFWYSRRNDMFCTFRAHHVCRLLVIWIFWKYVRFLWSMTIILSVILSSRYHRHSFTVWIIISIFFSVIV